MRTSIFMGGWSGLAAGVVALSWAVPASAAECADNADCPKGFTCEVSESVACPDTPPCPEGESCEEPPDCTVEEYRSCVSIDCSADSDCADGMVCETVTHERCSGSGGAPMPEPGTEPDPGADPVPPDAAPPEESCEVEERNYCVPKYLLPCEAAADCGPGFTCEATEQCACSTPSSGSGGSDGEGSDPGSGEDDAGDAERPAAPPEGEDGGGEDDGVDDSCECEPGPAECRLVVTACAANSDCASGMTCEDNPEGVCSSTPDGEVECTSDPEKICLPPHVDYAGGGIEEDGLGSDPTSNPEEPQQGAPGEGDDKNDADGSSEDSSASGGGCSVGAVGTPAGAWAGLGLMLGAAVLGRRRRR